MKRKHP